MPKTIGNFTESLERLLTTRIELSESIEGGSSSQYRWSYPFDTRKKDLEKLLDKYQVDSLSQLPVNFARHINAS